MTIGKLVSIAAITLTFVAPAQARPRPPVDPVKAGLDPARLAAIHAKMQEFIDARKIAGAITVVGRKDHLASVEVLGMRDVENKKPMELDTVFRIASMSKIVSSVAVMMLEADGKLAAEDPVEKHLPEFRGQKLIKTIAGDTVTLVAPERPITIEDLMTHTSGMNCELPPGFSDTHSRRHRPLSEVIAGISQHPLITPPGKVWKYCGPAFDVLGRLVEVTSGQSFESFLQQRLFRPLGMKDTTFHPTAAMRARLAIIYDNEKETIHRAPKQGFPAENIVYEAASGGLYSTALDYARLAQLLANRGRFGGKQLLAPAAFEKMTRVHFTYAEKVGFSPGLGMGLGVQVVMKPTEVTAALSPGSFGHGGAYGTQTWIDPKNELFYVLMIQRQGFGNGDQSDIRKALQELGASALVPKTAAAP
jgi:CubicO group peptidase (beta-lactamase class C family)